MATKQSRRRFVTNAAVAGAAGFGAFGAVSRGGGKSLAAEPAPEISTIRLSRIPNICIAPQYIISDLLRAEGFTEIQYIPLLAAYQHERLARRGRFQPTFRSTDDHGDRCRQTDHGGRRHPRRLL